MKMNRTALLTLTLVCAIAILSTGCERIKGMTGGSKDVMLTAASKPELKMFCDAVKKAGLDATLRGPGVYTVFAPTDDAFKLLPPEELNKLMQPDQKDALTAILKYHVIQGKYSEKDLKKMTSIKSLNGAMLAFAVEADRLKVGGAMVITKDIKCKNGVIHIIDTVMMPPPQE